MTLIYTASLLAQRNAIFLYCRFNTDNDWICDAELGWLSAKEEGGIARRRYSATVGSARVRRRIRSVWRMFRMA